MSAATGAAVPLDLPACEAEPLEAAAAGLEGQPLLLVGAEPRTRLVQSKLAAERAALARPIRCTSLQEAQRNLHAGRFAVVVLVPPLPDATAEAALARLRAEPPARQGRPRFAVLVPDDFPQERVWALYERGARGVFAWPSDVGILGALIGQALAPEQERDPEAALREVAGARLRVRLQRLASNVSLETRRGMARLSGPVSTLWAKLAVERHVESCPGIQGTDGSRLEVRASDRSDAVIGGEIRALLEGTSTIDPSTLGVTVHDGHVVLLGSVLAREREHIVELVAMVPGVRSVTDCSRGSPRHKRRARTLAARLQRRLGETDAARASADGLEAGHGLHVAVVGSTAVLRGVASRDRVDAALEALQRAAREYGLRRVLQRAVPAAHDPPRA